MQEQQHTVIIENDGHLASLIRDYLQQNGYLSKFARRGDYSVDIIAKKPALVVLDLVPPPGRFHLTVLQEFRSENDRTILILKSRDAKDDKDTKFIIGSDFQHRKSIEPASLLSRIHGLLGHFAEAIESTPLSSFEDSFKPTIFGDLSIDHNSHRVSVGRKDIDLTTSEFDLLWLFVSNVGVVLSRDKIFQTLRGFQSDGSDRSVDALVSRLRKKIESDSTSPKRIKTVWGKGYLFVGDC